MNYWNSKIREVYYGKEVLSRTASSNPFLSRTVPNKTAAQIRVALRLSNLSALMEEGQKFGVLAAYQPQSKSLNKVAHEKLLRSLREDGYKPELLRGKWEGVAEQSLIVPNMKWADLLELGRMFNQISVIFKSEDGIIGMYYLRDGYAEVAVDMETFEGAIKVSPDKKELWSKSRGLSFEFDFAWGKHIPWDGVKPISKGTVQSLAESGFFVSANP